MNNTDIAIIEGRDQNSNDVSYQIKSINPTVSNGNVRTYITQLNNLSTYTLLRLTRRHDEDITSD